MDTTTFFFFYFINKNFSLGSSFHYHVIDLQLKRLQDILQDDEMSPPISPSTSPCSEEWYNVTSVSDSPIQLKPCQVNK